MISIIVKKDGSVEATVLLGPSKAHLYAFLTSIGRPPHAKKMVVNVWYEENKTQEVMEWFKNSDLNKDKQGFINTHPELVTRE